jgi:hypothetical protein
MGVIALIIAGKPKLESRRGEAGVRVGSDRLSTPLVTDLPHSVV